jgi:hypothetical protein
MANKVKRKYLILIALLLVNVVGFFIADSYFKKQESETSANTSFIESAAVTGARILYVDKVLGVGIDLLRKIGD